MQKHATNFELVMNVAGARVVRLGDDDFGLYARGFRNRFGTPLLVRGSADELRSLGVSPARLVSPPRTQP